MGHCKRPMTREDVERLVGIGDAEKGHQTMTMTGEKKQPKQKRLLYHVPSIDYPPEVVERWHGQYVTLPDGRRALKWPILYVTHTDAIPSDCPCPMGVPITALDKGIGTPESGFEIVGLIDGDGFVDGKNVYKHIVVVNRALRARLLAARGGRTECADVGRRQSLD